MTTDVRALDSFFELREPLTRRTKVNGKATGAHLLAILPRGEAIRNFVYTGALAEVARQVEVSVLSVLPGEDFEGSLRTCTDNVYPLEGIKERYPVGVVRELLDLSHGRWLWSEAAQERWRLRDAEATTLNLKIRRKAKKLLCYPFASRRGLRFLSNCERNLSRLLRNTESYTGLLKQLRPSLVFNASHVHSKVAIQAVQAAQWLGIPTATFIFSWDNLTSQGRIMPPYDYYLVWNEAIREQLLQIYDNVRSEQVLVTGTPQFDFHFRPDFRWSRQEFCEHVGADPNRPIVLYSTGMPNHMPGEPEIVERIAAQLRNMTELGPPQLMVRVYPKDLTGRFAAVQRANPDVIFPSIPWEANWLTPRFEDAHLLTNMLYHSAVGVNVASTISLELCMFDKPVINVGYNPPSVDKTVLDYGRYYKFDHYAPVVESGAVSVASTEDELQSMLTAALTTPAENKTQRAEFIKKMFGETLDGYAGLRAANRLIQLSSPAQSAEIEGRKAGYSVA